MVIGESGYYRLETLSSIAFLARADPSEVDSLLGVDQTVG